MRRQGEARLHEKVRWPRLASALELSLLLCLAHIAAAEDASGMRQVGSEPLQGRSAYQAVPHRQNKQWLLYVGHHPGRTLNQTTGRLEENGMSIVDVTEPSRPQLLHHEPPSDSSWYQGNASRSGTYHLQVCDGAELPKRATGKIYVLRALGAIAHEVLDVTMPTAPRRVSLVTRAGKSDLAGFEGTHNSFWDCHSGIAYLASSTPGWRARRILRIFDLSDPAEPRHIRDFALPEMGPAPRDTGVRSVPPAVHAAELTGDKVYVSYGPFNDGILQIVDVEKLLTSAPRAEASLRATQERLQHPQISRLNFPSYWGVHTAKPILKMPIPGYASDRPGAVRDILVTVSEGGSIKCDQPRHVVFFIDITEPAFPIPISTYQAAERDGNYCNRSVLFGPHNVQASSPPMYEKKLLFVTYFAAGVRVVDIRNPFSPTEIGHFIPAANTNTRPIPLPNTDRWRGIEMESVPITNDVAVDERGYIYITDRAGTGLHVLELTGLPKEIANSAPDLPATRQ